MVKRIPIIEQYTVSSGVIMEVTVERLCDYLVRNKNLVFPHRHNFYHFLLFTKGKGFHTTMLHCYNITPNHLNALCKELLGLAAGEVIKNRIILEAKRLLVIRDFSIAEIAYELSFNDNSYFTKFFKKIEGVTPEEFRKKNYNYGK